jgi:alginate O-acetyltransferase complex protein AlgJ
MSGKDLSREAIARREIGRTAIDRTLSIVLVVFFIVAVFLVPLGQAVYDKMQGAAVLPKPIGGSTGSPAPSLMAAIEWRNNAILENIDLLEETLEERSLLRKVFLPPLQYVLLRFLGQGNEKAIPGRDGWLHFAPALEYLTGPPFLDPEQLSLRAEARELWEQPVHPDPVGAIVDFKIQLERRGIGLIVLPVPVKAAIQPDTLTGRSVEQTLANRSWQPFVAALKENGVQLFDVRPILEEYREKHGNAYLATDTHWLPGAMEAVAGELARHIVGAFADLPGTADFQLQPQPVVGMGDIARMLTLPEKAALFAGQRVRINQVTTDRNEIWQPDKNGPVLLLGDSFANIYSTGGLGWGVSAGLAEQLSRFLRQPIDLLARNDSGAYVTREMLAGELARGRDRLTGKRLVIWQFAERELAFGDWKKIDLRLGEKKETDFYVAPSGESVTVTGVVSAVSRSPRPGAVPYRDNILTLHLIDLHGENGKPAAGQALVYGWGMRDNQLTGLAALRPGDTVSLALTGWEAVEGEYGSYRRTPLDDEMMELEIPNWGNVINEKNN